MPPMRNSTRLTLPSSSPNADFLRSTVAPFNSSLSDSAPSTSPTPSSSSTRSSNRPVSCALPFDNNEPGVPWRPTLARLLLLPRRGLLRKLAGRGRESRKERKVDAGPPCSVKADMMLNVIWAELFAVKNAWICRVSVPSRQRTRQEDPIRSQEGGERSHQRSGPWDGKR